MVQIPQPEERCNDVAVGWIGDAVAFLSDRHGEFNLYTFDRRAGNIALLTDHDDFPIQSAQVGGGVVVYEQAGALHLFDPRTGASNRLRIGVAADLMETRPRWATGDEFIRSASLSPSGARAAFDFRG